MTNPTKGVFSVKEIAAEMAVILELPIEEYMLKSRFSHLIQWTGHSCVCIGVVLCVHVCVFAYLSVCVCVCVCLFGITITISYYKRIACCTIYLRR